MTPSFHSRMNTPNAKFGAHNGADGPTCRAAAAAAAAEEEKGRRGGGGRRQPTNEQATKERNRTEYSYSEGNGGAESNNHIETEMRRNDDAEAISEEGNRESSETLDDYIIVRSDGVEEWLIKRE